MPSLPTPGIRDWNWPIAKTVTTSATSSAPNALCSTPTGTSVTWQNDLALGEQHSLLLGGDWYEDRVHASTDFTEDSRWNRAVFLQHRYRGEQFFHRSGRAP